MPWVTPEQKHRRELQRYFFQNPGIIDPITSLASLRQTVLEISHNRLPKWRFRLDADLVVQIQPKPAERRDKYAMFQGLLIEGQEITSDHFSTWSGRHGQGMTAIAFYVREASDTYYATPHNGRSTKVGQWVFQFTRWNIRPLETLQALRERLVTALPRLEHLDTSFMFQPFCLLCGKHLTDPVSMARWIGPECAHHCGMKLSLDVGRLFKVSNAN